MIVSNRGPVSFSLDETAGPSRAAAAAGWCPAWRRCGGHRRDRGSPPPCPTATAPWPPRGPIEADGFHVHLLALDPDAYPAAYDVVGNETLWFLHHGLLDLARQPRFDDALGAPRGLRTAR